MTYRRVVWDHAVDHHGLISTRDAADLRVPAVELRKLASRGFLESLSYGLYRARDVPRSPNDQFAEAVRRVGPGAFLVEDAVLAVHDLAQVNPRRILVASPARVRAHWPDYLEVTRRTLPVTDLTSYSGIASSTVARALVDCRGKVMTVRLRDAAREAALRGLVTEAERQAVENTLDNADIA